MRRSRPVTWKLPGIENDEGVIWLGWIIRLRWVAIVAQMVTVSFTFRLLDSPATTLPILFAVMGGLAVANVLATPAGATPFDQAPAARPWPRAVLPQYSGNAALAADYVQATQAPSFYPFVPRVPQPAREPAPANDDAPPSP